MRKCEICGKTLPDEDFSKSYKKRCKHCVAEMTREKRSQIVHPVLTEEPITFPFNNSEAYWRTLRHEYSGRLLVGVLASAQFAGLSNPKGKEDYVKMAVSYADALIEELKKKEE